MSATEPSRAGRWQRDRAEEWLSWIDSGASRRREALRVLALAVSTVARTHMRDESGARAVVDELIPTLRHCDEIVFDRPEQAAAYAIWHLADRYARVVEALDGLFRGGHLPVRKTRMSVLEVGAGPAPAIYAANDYYLELAAWCSSTAQSFHPLAPTRLDTLDRAPAWGRFLHVLSEALPRQDALPRPLPFAVTYGDLRGFSVRDKHLEGIERAVRWVKAEADEWDEVLDDHAARQFALKERAYPPGAYDLIVMCNFLTSEEITAAFAGEIGGLARSLTPGGVLLVLGSADLKYDAVYARLRTIFEESSAARPVPVFDGPAQAHPDPRMHALVAKQVIDGLAYAKHLAPAAFAAILDQLPKDVRDLDPAKVRFPRFSALAYKNQWRGVRR